jgi:hypothetical protein
MGGAKAGPTPLKTMLSLLMDTNMVTIHSLYNKRCISRMINHSFPIKKVATMRSLYDKSSIGGDVPNADGAKR